MTPYQWILSRDTGISSQTIWGVMVGALPFAEADHFSDVPHDYGDFGRCKRLLRHFPEWRPRLADVARHYPEWWPLVREWDALTNLHDAGDRKAFDRRLDEVNAEGRKLVNRHPNRWEIKRGEVPA